MNKGLISASHSIGVVIAASSSASLFFFAIIGVFGLSASIAALAIVRRAGSTRSSGVPRIRRHSHES